MKISVHNSKYTFVDDGACSVRIDRYGEPWVKGVDGPNAITSMMYELDAARVVLAAARKLAASMEKMPTDLLTALAGYDEPVGLVRAVALHGSLVYDQEPPSEWADSAGVYREAKP